MTHYQITGMSCAACCARIEKAVRKVDGVTECTVNLLTNSASIEGSAAPSAIIQAITDAGYGASLKGEQPRNEAPSAADSEIGALKKKLCCSVFLLLILMYFSMGQMMFHFPLPRFFQQNYIALALVQLLLTIPILMLNRRFFISGFKAILHGSPNMDTLVALGSSVSFLWSTITLFSMTSPETSQNAEAMMEQSMKLYFESAAMIPTLISVGKMLEARAKGKTTDAIKGLMQLMPQTAVILRDGQECEIPAEDIQPDMEFILRPGAQIVADGIICSGNGTINESALTGESIPIEKTVGDTVSAGTINQSGYLVCKAVKTGKDTFLSQIIQMIENAAATKAPVAQTADKVSAVFVPAVMVLSLITFLIWNRLFGLSASLSLERAVTVLVISCPCALGLATPVAIMVGSGVGARSGMLFKTAAALEETGKTSIVVMDKTGTVTRGMPHITDILPMPGITKQELLASAAAAEQFSEHPLAKAVMEEAAAQGISIPRAEDFHTQTGCGVSVRCGTQKVQGGNEKSISAIAEIPTALSEQGKQLAENGKTPLFFARDGHLLGILAAADVIKPDSASAIAEMQKMGIETIMLTGDNEKTAAYIGKEAGISRIISNVLPDEKERVIRELAEKGRVCMIGDGINDAPALTSANVGMAIGAGTDIAIDAADVVLVNSSLADAVNAIRLSRKTLRNIRENLFWAFIYNIIGIPIAAGALVRFGISIPPAFGAAAMSMSSFCVVSNSLRLNLFKPFRPQQTAQPPAEIQSVQPKGEEEPMTNLAIEIKGMMCPHCEAHVRKALEAMEGVTVVSVSHEDALAVVNTAAEADEAAFRKVIEDAGYQFIGIRK
ncbi:MAG: heavy metal translocating P-type ATPase [Oscillospiraceae bacterium]|nr:heavy metal translocating P-type ATPase [Oscillospiraceae bacterium]